MITFSQDKKQKNLVSYRVCLCQLRSHRRKEFNFKEKLYLLQLLTLSDAPSSDLIKGIILQSYVLRFGFCVSISIGAKQVIIQKLLFRMCIVIVAQIFNSFSRQDLQQNNSEIPKYLNLNNKYSNNSLLNPVPICKAINHYAFWTSALPNAINKIVLGHPLSVNPCRSVFEYLRDCSLVCTRLGAVEKTQRFCPNGTLLFGNLLPVILEGHVWASIEGERVL